MASPDQLRRLDRLAGGAACALLALTGARRAPRPFRADTPCDVLVMQLAEMGSMVLALPALEELRARVPGVRLHFLVMKESRALIDALQLAPEDRVHALDFSGPAAAVRSLWSALRACRRAKLAAALHFDFFARGHAAFAALACPSGERAGFDNGCHDARRALLTRPVMYSPHHHTAEMFAVLVHSLFLDPGEAPFARIPPIKLRALPAYRAEKKHLEAVREKLGAAADRPLLLVSANASERLALRRWPVERFSTATQRWLDSHPDWHAVLIGSESDRATGAQVAAAHPRIIDLSGRTTFDELLALMSMARLLLCNDSGPAHFASLAALRSVVLFGPETPALYAPLGERTECLYADFACSPCVSAYNDKSSSCPRSVCLEHIGTDAVLSAMERALAKP
jgi:ADP-heptose:LPS heptosyltransferase